MKRTTVTMVFLWGVLGIGGATSSAAVNDSVTTTYALEDGSSYETGCFGPCACPVLTSPSKGTFELRRTGFDGLFDTYDVANVKWVVARNDGELRISGSGKYRVGGEFGVEQQLSLDLMVGGNPTQHFDSGPVPGGGDFPRIDVQVSIHGMMACVDTVMRVRASPVVAGADRGSGPRSFGLNEVKPNPFRGQTDVGFALREPGSVNARVYDTQGRGVRVLASGAWVEGGPHSLTWDGNRDDGAEAAPGFYFLHLRVEGRDYRRGVVKLE